MAPRLINVALYSDFGVCPLFTEDDNTLYCKRASEEVKEIGFSASAESFINDLEIPSTTLSGQFERHLIKISFATIIPIARIFAGWRKEGSNRFMIHVGDVKLNIFDKNSEDLYTVLINNKRQTINPLYKTKNGNNENIKSKLTHDDFANFIARSLPDIKYQHNI